MTDKQNPIRVYSQNSALAKFANEIAQDLGADVEVVKVSGVIVRDDEGNPLPIRLRPALDEDDFSELPF